MRHSSDLSQGISIDPWIRTLVVPALFAGLDYRVVTYNERARHLFDIPTGDRLRGTQLRSLVAPRDAPEFFSDLIALQKDDGSVQETRVNLIVADGQKLFAVTPLRGTKNAILGFMLQQLPEMPGTQIERPRGSVVPDINPPTDSLAESEWRWKMALQNGKHGLWDHDFEYDRHYVSKIWRELRGLMPGDAIPTSTEDWLQTIHPGDLAHLEEELDKLEAGVTDIINYKFRQRHAAGHWVWFYSKGRVVRRDAQGGVARMIGTDTDITEIKKVEMESQRMAHRLNTALEASGIGRWEFDIEAKYAFWDDRVLAITGVDDGLNIRSAEDWANTIHPEDRGKAVALAEQCLAEERDVFLQYRVQRPDGSVRHVRSRAVYVKDEETGPRYYGVKIDVTDDLERTRALEEARAQLEFESRHDALTGLANRRYLDTHFSEISEDPSAHSTRVAVMHFDIDHFKQINDTLGHDAGDALLKHAAKVLTENLPQDTLVSRVGGDEFVALLNNAPEHAVLRKMGQNIVSEMARPFPYQGQLCNIGTSIGVALSDPGEAVSSALFIDADLALYEAKKAGRARVRFFNDEMKAEARRRKNSFDALLEGFDQGEITCHYQPQFDAQTLKLMGVEALVRWESARYGLIMPNEFLETAADMGLMPEFDELVLRQALDDLAGWEAAGLHVPRISVNVSSHRLNDTMLGSRLSKLDLPRGRVSFELLESAFLDSRNEVIDTNLSLLDEIGVEIEIDDFGSGHASIVSLLQIAPKRLKIDRMLIAPVVASQRQRDLVATIINIGKMLDVSVIAEGVETPDHVRVMRTLDCDGLQGFGLAHPMERNALQALLERLQGNDGKLPDPKDA
jgi:diguanylate cyclase (GGDEF)-like protein/PAS domain S-box-containing protein